MESSTSNYSKLYFCRIFSRFLVSGNTISNYFRTKFIYPQVRWLEPSNNGIVSVISYYSARKRLLNGEVSDSRERNRFSKKNEIKKSEL